jgi:hypothetical protein
MTSHVLELSVACYVWIETETASRDGDSRKAFTGMTSRGCAGSRLIRQISQHGLDWVSQRTTPSPCYPFWPRSQQPLSWLTSTPSAGRPMGISPRARHKVQTRSQWLVD